jgi:hypothetical protein
MSINHTQTEDIKRFEALKNCNRRISKDKLLSTFFTSLFDLKWAYKHISRVKLNLEINM